MSKIITEETKQKIRKYYIENGPMSMGDVKKEFNYSLPIIGDILKDIPKYNKVDIRNKQMNHNYFQTIDTEEKAYFLGLLIADGNVFEYNYGNDRSPSISIVLSGEDEYMVQKFKDAIGCSTQIIGDERDRSTTVAFRSKQIASDLSNFGVVPRKSDKTFLPILDNKNLMNHLIRGIFDGDGCVQAHYWRNKFLHYIEICGTERLLQDIVDYVSNEIQFNFVPKVYKDKRKSFLCEIRMSSIVDMYTFGEWLYKDASTYLHRKKEVFEFFKQHYKL